MKSFTTGLVAGAMIGVGMSLLTNPMNKREMRKLKCKTNRLMRGLGSTLNHWM